MAGEKVKHIDWKPKWEGGAPMPQVFSNGRKVYLIYTLADWELESIDEFILLDQAEENRKALALVEFDGNTFKYGIANDEVFSGLPLFKQGLSWVQEIENSEWINEIKQIHKVHPYYNETKWIGLKHYLFLFKDEIFEVLTRSYKIEIFETTLEKLVAEILKRMNT